MGSEEKIDLFKQHKTEYAAGASPAIVKTGPAAYLAIEGRGRPGSESFHAKIGALYSVAFTLKMSRKADGPGPDYVVSKLEALWWCDDGADMTTTPQEEWRWKLLIRTPDFVSSAELEEAVSKLVKKGGGPEISGVALERIDEGDCVQMLHVGPYENEGESVAMMDLFARNNGWLPYGRHHEIYLSDPRRVSPERLKTILRIAVRRA